MNEKQGNLLDQRIRQALGSLPDAPPPGSPFDSARLWEQLRPELNAQQPVSRKRVGGWWWAAALVAGLLVVGFWYGQSASKQTTTISQSVSLPPRSEKYGPVFSQTEVAKQTAHPSARRKNNLQTAVAVRFATKAEAETVSIQQTEQPIIREPVSLTPLVEIPKTVVATLTKKRFRVVHENELIAEDEAHRVRYAPGGRTERFVRLGTGSQSQTIANEELPALQLPLHRKTTQ